MSKSSSFAGAATGALRFAHWWKRELRACIPAFVRPLLQPRTLIASVEEGTLELIDERWRGRRLLGSARLDDDQELAHLARRAVRIAKARGARLGLRLSRGPCLVRRLQLPIVSRARQEAMIKLELERLLPNDVSGVSYDWVANDAEAREGQVPVDLVICKKAYLESLLGRLASVRLAPAVVDCWRDGTGAYAIDLAKRASPSSGLARPLHRFERGLGLAVLALIISAPLIWQIQRMGVSSALTARVDAMRAEAQAARAEDDRLSQRDTAVSEFVQRRATQPLMIEIWAEIARLLPDDAYAEEIALDGGKVMIDGRAKSAAPLVPAFELSPLFKEAALSSSIVLDQEAGLERFSISLVLEQGPTTAEIPAEGAIQ